MPGKGPSTWEEWKEVLERPSRERSWWRDCWWTCSLREVDMTHEGRYVL